MSISFDDFDVEAAFEKELARVKLEDSRSDGRSGQELEGLQDASSFDSEDENGDNDSAERREPASLQLLRVAIERRERAAEEFGRDWERFCLEVAGTETPRAAPDSAVERTVAGPPADKADASRSYSPSAILSSTAVGRQDSVDTGLSLQDTGETTCTVRDAEVAAGCLDGGEPASVAASAAPGDTGLEAAAVLQRRAVELEEQRRRALAELDEELARTAAERQAEIAAVEAEQRRLAAETEATYQRLVAASREAEERRALQEARLAALRQEALGLARKHMAACRICRAWRRFQRGPARAARVAATVCIQAAWRGYVVRRCVARLRAQRAILQAVEEAAREGKAELLETAMSRAQEIGLGDDASARLAVLDAAVADAAAKLRAAASGGTYSDYRAALAAAQAFPSLAQMVVECTAVFEQRRADAEAAVYKAVADEPMPDFYRLIDSMAPLGIQPQRLTAAVEAVRQRDEQLVAKLAAVSRAQGAAFSPVVFDALVERAVRLGLKGDAAAARLVVERRRRSLAAALRTQGSAVSGAAECLRIVEEARRMGMATEAESLMQHLRTRQTDAQAALRAAVEAENVSQVVLLLQRACQLQVSVAVLQDSTRLLRNRQAARIQALADAAACESLHGFLAARGASVHGGAALGRLLTADSELTTKRRAAARTLMQATGNILGALEGLMPRKGYGLAALLAPVMRLGSSRAVLRRAAGRDASAPNQVILVGGSAKQTAGSNSQIGDGARQCQQAFDSAAISTAYQPGYASPSQQSQRSVKPYTWLALERAPPGLSGLLELTGPGPRNEGGNGWAAPAGSVSAAVVVGWPCWAAAVKLGLSDVVCLALCALDLYHTVQLAAGSHSLRTTVVRRDYWGILLPSPPTAAVGASTAPAGRSEGGPADELLGRLGSLLRQNRNVSPIRPWVPPLPVVVVKPVPATYPPAADSSSGVAAVMRSSCGSDSATLARSGLPALSVAGGSESLTHTIILRNVPEAAGGLGAGGGSASLRHLVRLDLGLERLTGLKGLEALCPSLRALSADANRLSSLEGLAGLSALRELSLKQNQLTSLLLQPGGGSQTVPGLPVGSYLRQLALDSNKLSGPLRGLSGCCGLRSLSLADNALTDIAAELETSAPVLTSLCLRGNALTSLQVQLVALTSLRELDVSGNRLTSLEGIQGLLMLQTLHASGNDITVLPERLCLPHLTSLDLGQNSLTVFPHAGGSPAEWTAGNVVLSALERLVLQENMIACLGPFGPMPHLTLLDLSFNRLESVDALLALGHLSALRKLHIGNNPMTVRMPPGANFLTQLRLRAAPLGGLPLHPRELSALTATTEWALPSLRELDHDEVGPRERLGSVVRAAAVSPVCAVAATRQLQGTGACYLVYHVRGPAVATATAYGRQPCTASTGRSAASGRSARRPLVRFAGDLGSPANPVAMRGLLAVNAAESAIGNAALCGLHAEMAAGWAAAGLADSQQLGVKASDVRGAQPKPGTRGSAVANRKRQPPRPAAAKWLSRVEQLWQAAGPSEAVELHMRQLALTQSLWPWDAPACAASAGAALGPRLLDAADSAARSAIMLQHCRADLLDFRAVRCLRPAARFAQDPAFAGASSGVLASAAIAGAAGAQQRHGAVAGVGAGAASWAVGAEAQGRIEAGAARMVGQLMGELRQLCLKRGARLSSSCTMSARPSYFLGRMLQDASAAATRIEAFWRGACVRRAVPMLQVQAASDKSSRASAATTIQAWWRGHSLRRAKLLLRLRQEEGRRRLEVLRREAAATTIQAHVRGHLVRKHLRAALVAARGAPGSQQDLDPDLQLMNSSELDDMLQGFLSPIEKLLGEDDTGCDQPAPSSSAMNWSQPQRLPGLQQQQLRSVAETGFGFAVLGAPRHVPMAAAWPGGPNAEVPQGQQAWMPGARTEADAHLQGRSHPSLPLNGSLSSTAALTSLLPSESMVVHPAVAASRHSSDQGRYPEPLTADFSSLGQQLPVARATPLLSPGMVSLPAGLLPPISVRSSTPHSSGLASARAQPTYDNAMERLSPLSSEAQISSPGFSGPQHSLGVLRRESTSSDYGVPVLDTASVHDREERHQRHIERIQKLMAEWGFKDWATAEAYYRRSLKQKQGHTRRNGQGKHPGHAQRLAVPQQRVEPRQPAGGTGGHLASGTRPPPGTRHRVVNKASTTGSAEEPSGATAVPQRNLNSADGVLVGGSESAVATAGMLGRSGSTPRSGGRQILAPLGPISAIKQSSKAAIAPRPHHLPALASNNWFATNPQLEIVGTLEGKRALHGGEHTAIRPGPPSIGARPGTVQSVDSIPEVIML